MPQADIELYDKTVALFTRAWIEIPIKRCSRFSRHVALFTRAWIEISFSEAVSEYFKSRPLYEGVD